MAPCADRIISVQPFADTPIATDLEETLQMYAECPLCPQALISHQLHRLIVVHPDVFR